MRIYCCICKCDHDSDYTECIARKLPSELLSAYEKFEKPMHDVTAFLEPVVTRFEPKPDAGVRYDGFRLTGIRERPVWHLSSSSAQYQKYDKAIDPKFSEKVYAIAAGLYANQLSPSEDCSDAPNCPKTQHESQ